MVGWPPQLVQVLLGQDLGIPILGFGAGEHRCPDGTPHIWKHLGGVLEIHHGQLLHHVLAHHEAGIELSAWLHSCLGKKFDGYILVI